MRLIYLWVAIWVLPFRIQEVLAQENDRNKFLTFGDDGAWCWFSDPRAVSMNGKVYSGWVRADGSIMVASYTEATGKIQEVNISQQFEKDDHANPSFLILPDNRIMVFFSAHGLTGKGEDKPGITYAISKSPEDISEWESSSRLVQNAEGPMGFCYTNPVMLADENNRIYLFWRGGDWKPTFSYTDDQGKTWSKVFSLVRSTGNVQKRPYTKISSNGKDEIHFAFTDGHPRNEPFNSIYYVRYKAGKFYKADGTEIGKIESLPLIHEECDVVYDAYRDYLKTANGIRSWIWDVAIGDDGHPVLVYTKLPTESEHRYWYARWDGTKWVNSKIDNAGSWFPRYARDKSTREPEPHYSGGVYIDHENVFVVYYSKPVGDVFEIFRAESKDRGATWESVPVTSGSDLDNVRPFAIRGADWGSPQVMWMQNEYYSQYTDFKSRIKMDIKKK